MTPNVPSDRVFLFLQGPHGPFFSQLAAMMRVAGAEVWRVGFNAGDEAFWSDTSRYIPFQGEIETWAVAFADILTRKSITDIVLYGDTRPVHAQAVQIAKSAGVTVHVFEEGYMRPWWVTYERGGSNGHSRLMDMSVAEMEASLKEATSEPPMPPGHWGDLRHHVFYGALYHWFVMFRNGKYRNFTPHRDISVKQEFMLYFKRLASLPLTAARRALATMRIRRGRFPYHVALLQLEHDSAFQAHSNFASMTDFLELVIDEFARGAPQHHHLVIKTHPLEDGRAQLESAVIQLVKSRGLQGRVHCVGGGKLAPLLRDCKSAVTVNSTAGQQVLWRGIPLKVFGDAVYDKPELVSDQPLAKFFAAATRPNADAYRIYRRYLLETSQLPGGFYSGRGRRQLLRQVVDLMLFAQDPYDALTSGTASPRQQLRVVR